MILHDGGELLTTVEQGRSLVAPREPGEGLGPFWEVPDDGEGTLTGGESGPRPEGSLGRGNFHRG